MSLHVEPGDRVMVRGVSGRWRPGVAASGVRVDHASLFEGQEPYETVSVRFPDADHPFNWPAEDVASLAFESPWWTS